MRTKLIILALLTLFISVEAKNKQPNIIIIYIDDMGYGDIEPFGSTINKTPQLNRMAEEGMRFTSFYSACPVCSPSRAALLTGCYPNRVGLEKGSWHWVLFQKDKHGLNPDELSIAKILQQKGYSTACFGKWHLGDQVEFLPLNHGFDTYLGIPYSNNMWPKDVKSKNWKVPAPPLPIVKDMEVIGIVDNMNEQADLCKMFTDATVDFIETNKDKPFFIYIPHAFIHLPRLARKQFMEQAGIDNYDENRFQSDYDYQLDKVTRAQIEEVDWSVGEILNTLRINGLEENTLVLFTSDNGGSAGSSNAPLNGKKGTTWEGGMREPCIFWWPGTIPANTQNDEIATTMDMLPTIANLVGAELPENHIIDGKDITSLLKNKRKAKSAYEAFFYFKKDEIEAVRSGNWKLRLGELYNLQNDIGEKQNIANEYPEVVARLNGYIYDMKKHISKPENCRPHGFVSDPQYLELKK